MVSIRLEEAGVAYAGAAGAGALHQVLNNTPGVSNLDQNFLGINVPELEEILATGAGLATVAAGDQLGSEDLVDAGVGATSYGVGALALESLQR